MKNIFRSFLRRTLRVFLIALTSAFTLHAQVAPYIEWQKCLGGSIGEPAYSIQQSADGGFVVAGYSWSIDGDVSGNHGLSDYWIVKLDTAGNLVWQKSFGGSNNDVAWAMDQTADGGFVVAGYSRSNDGDITSNAGLTDYCIMKLDAAGNLEWQKSLGGSDDDWAYAIRQTTEGGFIVAGHSKSNDGDVSGNHGDWDYWVVNLDVNGNLLWQRSLGGSDEDEAYAVVQTADGGFVIAGGSDSNDGDASGNHGDGDAWIVKLDLNGNLLWQKSLGGSGDDYAYSIQQTTDGNLIVAGSSPSNDGDVSGNHGHTDYWIMKLDDSGNLLWQKSLGGSDYDQVNSIQQTIDGGFIVAGYSYSSDGDVSVNHGLNDYWIVKLDTAGNLVWKESLGGSDYDQANSIQQSADGGFIIAGLTFSNDNDVSGNHDDNFGTSEDYWIVKLSSDSLTYIVCPPAYFSFLYPNPVQNLLTVSLATQAADVSIDVYDLQGRLIALPTTFTNTQTQLNTTSLAEGFYTLQITNNKTGESKVGKFVKGN